ncbi:hypothetical protein HZB96_01645 [Candidatus Gottesmanbacteria bacterium]|nr:hypothetical protein [Candidatus Gottesmanbacteria bacterium]
MDLLVSASFIASFFAGVAALFAPCCITVLLPTFLASTFKQKTTIFLMTFIFFLGLLTIFLPLGLGASFLSQIFSQYHNIVFSLGAIFLIILGTSLLLGLQFSLPLTIHPELKKYDFGSVYVLGIFSAVATTCCAPVLAGVLALSILPGSIFLGAIYTLAYVLGMIIPLFIIAAFLDKINFTQKFFAFRKTINYSLFGKKIKLPLSYLFSGLMFLILGIIVLFLAQTNQLTSHSSYQVTINIYLTKLVQLISKFTKLIPELFWALLFVGILLLILKLAVSQLLSIIKKGEKHEV